MCRPNGSGPFGVLLRSSWNQTMPILLVLRALCRAFWTPHQLGARRLGGGWGPCEPHRARLHLPPPHNLTDLSTLKPHPPHPTVSSRPPPRRLPPYLAITVSPLKWQRTPRRQRAHERLLPASARAASPSEPPPSRRMGVAVIALPPIRNLVRLPLAALGASLGACGSSRWNLWCLVYNAGSIGRTEKREGSKLANLVGQ